MGRAPVSAADDVNKSVTTMRLPDGRGTAFQLEHQWAWSGGGGSWRISCSLGGRGCNGRGQVPQLEVALAARDQPAGGEEGEGEHALGKAWAPCLEPPRPPVPHVELSRDPKPHLEREIIRIREREKREREGE